ncbi:MAG: aminoglycoside phosphotransferase family protein [Magnetococcales bacterium]|nr:aminoglycoside phosphotransferase family protein [Magnetococcales bacterium]
MSLSEESLQQLLQVAEGLLGAPLCLREIGGGGNHRLLRLASAEGEYALKYDPLPDASGRDRLAREWHAIAFLREQGMTDLPQPLAWSAQDRCALYQWIDGQRVTALTLPLVTEMLAFLQRLRRLEGLPSARQMPLASDAFVTPSAVVAQFRRRYERLWQGQQDPELQKFLQQRLLPLAETVMAQAETALADLWQQTVPMMLSPSDFGIHNLLRQADGRLIFLDLEYFGWDDPSKLCSDFLWHPAMLCPEDAARCWLQGMQALSHEDADFRQRFAALHPLNGLIWCLILLNPFLPEGWQRLTTSQPKEQLLAQRLAEANQRVQLIKKGLPS